MPRLAVQVLTLCLAATAAHAQAKLPPLPAAEASKLRDGLREAFAEPGGKSGAKLAAQAKAWSAKHDFDSLLAALRAGPDVPKGDPKPRGKGKSQEPLERFGSVWSGFTFTVGRDSFRYAVDVPRDYDAKKPSPLLIDPGHGSGAKEDAQGKAGFLAFYRGRADDAGIERCLVARTEIVEQIGTDGLRGARPDDEIAAVFDAFFRDLCSRFAVDLDRVYVAGLSQTGFWSWQLGNARADRFAGIAPMGAVSAQQASYLANFLALSVYVLHGSDDPICPIAQPRATVPLLEKLGVRVHFEEVAGGKHDASVWVKLDDGLRWLAERPRDPYPKKIAKCLQTSRSPWCYWIRVDELEREGSGEAGAPPTARIAAEIAGQEVKIESEGVEKITVGLSRELLDLAQPVTVTWNRKLVHEGALERDFARTLELALDKVDWRGTFEAAVELKAPR